MAGFFEQRFRALYLHDEQGRITTVNQWDGGDVPRFHLMRTGQSNGWRFRSDMAEELVRELEALCLAEPVTALTAASPNLAEQAMALLSASARIEALWQGPLFTLTDSSPVGSDIEIVQLSAANARLLEPGMPDWLPDVPHRAPFLAAVIDNQAVSVCASVRIGAQVHEAGVETRPGYRGRGLARAVVTAWAEAVRNLGALPVYSTSQDNVASQGVARSLGADLIGTDFHVR